MEVWNGNGAAAMHEAPLSLHITLRLLTTSANDRVSVWQLLTPGPLPMLSCLHQCDAGAG